MYNKKILKIVKANDSDLDIQSLKNVLIVYRGGGYDGCFWEPNVAFFDSEEIFYDILSTGCNGCKTINQVNL